MIVKLKRIYSYFIELLAIIVICYFIYVILGMGLFFIISDSFKTSKYMYMYEIPVLGILVGLYLCFRNVFNGQSVMQMMFGIKYKYKNKKQLIFKNIIDLCLLPISFLTVLIWNKSVGDLVFNISVVEEIKTDKKSSNVFMTIMMIWFTVIPLFLILAFSWRVNKSELELEFKLNNTQTIKENIGFIESFSFNNKIFWSQYDKEGEYIGATVKNKDNIKIKIKIYLDTDGAISYLVIDGQRYEYEIEHFDLKDYKTIVDEFGEEIKVTEIKNEKESYNAANEACKIKNLKKEANYKNYKILYDKEQHCYLIRLVKSINYDTMGGEYNTIIQEDGHVLAMWGGK